jgi:RNA polymerase sigma factor (sigma-70 family)
MVRPFPKSLPPEASTDSAAFSTTQWSTVLRAGEDSSPAAHQALERLCATYWYPLYVYVRRQGHGATDAQDLTQEFFSRLLGRKSYRLADPSRGRFRSFLLTSLKHFLINEWSRAKRQKRGGGAEVISLDEALAESRLAAEPAVELPPESLYDLRWAAVLLDRAFVALRGEFEQSGRQDAFERLKAFAWGDKNALSCAAMAQELNMTEGAVRVAVHRLRQRYGELLRTEVAQTVATPGEVEEELRYLVSVFRTGLVPAGNVTPETR